MILAVVFFILFFIAFIIFSNYLTYVFKKPLPDYAEGIERYFPATYVETQQKDTRRSGKPKKAYVFCSPDKTFQNVVAQYAGYKDCRLFKKYHESEAPCSWACIGFGSCIPHCPQDAIVLINNTAVITDACNGCGICVDFCPNNVIKLIPVADDFVVACSSRDSENTSCSRVCTGCSQCVDNVFYSGFKVKDKLAVSDYIPNQGKASYAKKCPQKSIVKIDFPRKNTFKFFSLCCTIRDKQSKKDNGN